MAELRVTVLGGGSWGSTVAHLCAHNTPTTLWARDPATVAAVNDEHRNPRYLGEGALHERLRATNDFAAAVAGADVLVMGVPTGAFRETARAVTAHVGPWVPIVSLAKGFEEGSRLRMTQILEQELPGRPIGVLTGPNLAREVLAGLPAAAVLALTEFHIAQRLQALFTTPTFRVFLHHDVIGCEVGGALKNVYAIAAGSAEGRQLGDNARAAIITRGLAELIELGGSLGAEALTLAGLAGMGDLMATCISPQSRNFRVGFQLGQGRTIAEILGGMDQVAEGVKAAKVVRELAAEHGVFMPIAAQVFAVCWEGKSPEWAHESLMRGRVGHEAGSVAGLSRRAGLADQPPRP
ncbi:MAG: NAD(P)-dependent glycerol-3-phosphate dehydrogenase [Acidimicrobiia bacterium]|nr:NAD(P)-dependent glycerol-3-phosphate dehydrogenase [Acidimicrobiia bacterium]